MFALDDRLYYRVRPILSQEDCAIQLNHVTYVRILLFPLITFILLCTIVDMA